MLPGRFLSLLLLVVLSHGGAQQLLQVILQSFHDFGSHLLLLLPLLGVVQVGRGVCGCCLLLGEDVYV